MKFQIEKLVDDIRLVFEDGKASIKDLINVIIDFVNALLRNEEF